MFTNLAYLAAALGATIVIVRIAPHAATAVTLCIILIALTAVVATLSRETTDLVSTLNAATDLIHGRPEP